MTTHDVFEAIHGLTPEPNDAPATSRRPSPGKISLTARIPPRPRAPTDQPVSPENGVGALVTAVQLHGPGADTSRVHREAQRGLATPTSELPFRSELEQAFGPEHDLSGIRAHVGGEAEQSARSMNAEAFASGHDIVLPANPSLRLVAHEVTHTIQQRGGVHLSGGVGEVGDPYEQQADDVAERVHRRERVGHLLPRSAVPHVGGSVQRQAVPPPAGGAPPPGDGRYVDTKSEVNVPNREHVIEITNDDSAQRFSVAGQLKVVLPNSPIVTASAAGTVDAGAAGDHDASAKIDALSFQQKGTFRPKETEDKGRRFTSRLALSLAKPGGKLTAFPGLTVEVGGDLGQLNLANGQLNLGSINFSVKGDVTTWVLGADAKRAGIKVELVALIRVRILPGDLKILGKMARAHHQLEKADEAARKIRGVTQSQRASLASKELQLARAMRQDRIEIGLVRKLEHQIANIKGRIAARARALKAIRSTAKSAAAAVKSGANRLASRGAQLVGKQLLDMSSRLLQAILKTVNAALIIIDLIQIAVAVYRIIDGTAEARLGGGGPGSMLKKGVPGGTAPDGNSETEGAQDATGTGVGTGNDAKIAADTGGEEPVDGDGGTSAADDGSVTGEGGDDGVASDDGSADDLASPLVDDDTAGDVSADDADDDDGGLGTSAPQKPGGGPGAGASTGSKPSFSTAAGTDAVDRNASADSTSAPPPNATPADTSGAAAHDGSVSTSGADNASAPASSSSDPAELVTNQNALRIMSALHGLGQPATPEIVALVEAIVPADLAQAEVDALIDELMLWLVPGDQATDDTTIEGIAEAVTGFLERRDNVRRANGKKGSGAAGAATGGGTAATGADAGGTAASGAKPTPKATSGGTEGAPGKSKAKKDKAVDHGRVLLKGAGLTPTIYEDGTVALSQDQAHRWLTVSGDEVKMSDAGKAWLAANDGLKVKTKPHAMALTNVEVAGNPRGDGSYDAAITFGFAVRTKHETAKIIRFIWTPDAPKGKRVEVPQTLSLEPLERLVSIQAFTATIQTDVPVDLGPFTVRIVELHNTPYFDGTAGAPLTFLLTIEIVAVRDFTLSTFRGHPIKVGTTMTESFSLRAPGR